VALRAADRPDIAAAVGIRDESVDRFHSREPPQRLLTGPAPPPSREGRCGAAGRVDYPSAGASAH
jgi:hypothetical protein